MLGGLPRDRPEPAGASPDRPAKPCRTARADSFGTRTGRGPGGAIAAVTAAQPSPDHRFGDKPSNITARPGRRQDVLWRFDGLAVRVRYPETTETLAAGLRRLRLRRSRMHPLRGSGYFAEFVRGLGLHAFGLSGGRARSSGCAALRIDGDRLKGIF